VQLNQQTVAAISISGSGLDVLGSLYLAYDLLGSEHGPLRLLTRMVTYSILAGLGFGIGLGAFFGLTAGVTTAVTASIELNREARHLPHYSLTWQALFAAIRSAGFGAGLYPIVGFQFAAAFAVLNAMGQVFAYSRGVRPGMDYSRSRRPRLTRRQFSTTVVRSLGFIVTALLCSAFVHHVDHPLLFALRVGLVTGIVTWLFQMVNPFIEYFAENLPERTLGVFGADSCFVALPCNRSNIGWRCLMSTYPIAKSSVPSQFRVPRTFTIARGRAARLSFERSLAQLPCCGAFATLGFFQEPRLTQCCPFRFADGSREP
jgi:hypothetical protein